MTGNVTAINGSTLSAHRQESHTSNFWTLNTKYTNNPAPSKNLSALEPRTWAQQTDHQPCDSQWQSPVTTTSRVLQCRTLCHWQQHHLRQWWPFRHPMRLNIGPNDLRQTQMNLLPWETLHFRSILKLYLTSGTGIWYQAPWHDNHGMMHGWCTASRWPTAACSKWCINEWHLWQCSQLDYCNLKWLTVGRSRTCTRTCRSGSHWMIRKDLDSCQQCNFWFIAVITATCHLTNLTNWSKVYVFVTTKAWHPEHQNCWTSRCKLLPCLSVMIVTCAAKSKTASHELQNALSVSMHHIKGHQDQTPIMSADGTPQPLSWQAELNIKCDHGACMAVTGNLWQNSTEQQSPMFPAAWVHLLIRGEIVTWQTKEWLQGAATTQDCREHLCTKFEWDDNACDAVNWSSMHLALKQFQKADQWQLQKWIHDWLPLNAFLHKQKPHHCATCPTCNEMAEDHWHFLKCKHPTWHQMFATLWSTSADFCTKSKAGDDLFALPWDGIQAIWQNKAMHPQEAHAKHLHALHQSQSSVSWDQLFHGWFSQLWGTIFETAGAPTEEIDVATGGTQWIAELTMTTWQHVLLLWDSQNGDQHGHTQAEKEWKECDKLAPQMQGACSIKNQLPEAAQQQLHWTSLTELLQQLTSNPVALGSHCTTAHQSSIASCKDAKMIGHQWHQKVFQNEELAQRTTSFQQHNQVTAAKHSCMRPVWVAMCAVRQECIELAALTNWSLLSNKKDLQKATDGCIADCLLFLLHLQSSPQEACNCWQQHFHVFVIVSAKQQWQVAWKILQGQSKRAIVCGMICLSHAGTVAQLLIACLCSMQQPKLWRDFLVGLGQMSLKVILSMTETSVVAQPDDMVQSVSQWKTSAERINDTQLQWWRCIRKEKSLVTIIDIFEIAKFWWKETWTSLCTAAGANLNLPNCVSQMSKWTKTLCNAKCIACKAFSAGKVSCLWWLPGWGPLAHKVGERLPLATVHLLLVTKQKQSWWKHMKPLSWSMAQRETFVVKHAEGLAS